MACVQDGFLLVYHITVLPALQIQHPLFCRISTWSWDSILSAHKTLQAGRLAMTFPAYICLGTVKIEAYEGNAYLNLTPLSSAAHL